MTIPKLKKNKILNMKPVSVILKNIGEKPTDGKTKIKQLMRDFHENGILLAMIFFSLPVAVPLPYPPGFTTLMGLPLLFLSYQLLIGSKAVNLPQKINNYEIQNSTLKKISEKTVPLIEIIEQYIKPRCKFASSVYCEQLVGLVCIIASLAVAIPLPFTNAIPALGISVMSLGLLNRDGLIVFCGALIACFGTIIAILAIIGSFVFIKSIFSFLF